MYLTLFFILLISLTTESSWIASNNQMTYQEWLSDKNVSDKLQIEEVYSFNIRADSLLEIVVTSDLYPHISTNLQMLVNDIQNDGYDVDIDIVSSVQGLPACDSLRNFLFSKLSQGLIGVFFIGEVPIAWYQMVDDYGQGPLDYGYFPCDLYYLDLDGIWTDDSIWDYNLHKLIPGSDGILDGHTGNVHPDIWVGRLYFSTLGNEAELVNRYLRRDHLYRTDSLSAVHRGLCYVDDDWAINGNSYMQEMNYAFSNVNLVSHPETTRVSNYITHLQDNYEIVGLFCHSHYNFHSFYINNGIDRDLLYSTSLPGIAPQGLFYILFACHNVSYLSDGYMGGTYVIKTPRGLGAFGETKGYGWINDENKMADYYYFYYSLGQNKTIGNAFFDWFGHLANGGFNIVEKTNYYGYTYIGDPSLKLLPAASFLSNEEIIIYDATGNNDGRLDPGENADIYITVKNHYDAVTSGNVTGELYCSDNDINVISNYSSFGSIPPGDSSINSTPFSVQVSSNAQNHITSFALYLTDGLSGKVFSDTFYIYIGREPILIIDDDGGNIAEEAFTESLDSLGLGWEIIGRDTFFFDYDYLLPYQAVIWFTGNQAESTLTVEDQIIVEGYFNNNGNIFLSGQNIAEELQGSLFLQDFLKINWIGNTSVYFQDGISGNPIGDGIQILTTSQTSQDILIPQTGANPSFSYRIGTDSISMINIEGAGKVVFAGFGFEKVLLSPPTGYASRDTLLARILNYFNISTYIEEFTDHTSSNFSFEIEQLIYNSSGINFTITGSLNSNITVNIYNILGSPIKTVYTGLIENNSKNLYWNFTNDRGDNIPSGLYFICLISQNNSISKKIYIIK